MEHTDYKVYMQTAWSSFYLKWNWVKMKSQVGTDPTDRLKDRIKPSFRKGSIQHKLVSLSQIFTNLKSHKQIALDELEVTNTRHSFISKTWYTSQTELKTFWK